eukprot:932483-Amorphochlora_amoeboformis.AAC.1
MLRGLLRKLTTTFPELPLRNPSPDYCFISSTRPRKLTEGRQQANKDGMDAFLRVVDDLDLTES